MHALYHLVAHALGAARECLDQGAGAFDFGFGRGESFVTGGNLLGVDEAFAVEAERAPFAGFGEETGGPPDKGR